MLKDETLVTIRYAQPKPFNTYADARAEGRRGALHERRAGHARAGGSADRAHGGGAGKDRRANLERLSREVFRRKPPDGKPSKSRDFEAIIEQIGAKGDLLAMIRESLVSLNRLLAYHTTTAKAGRGPQQGRGRVGEGHAAGRGRAQRSRHLSDEQDQLPARRDARPDQPRAEPDHQDLLDRGRRADAADPRRLVYGMNFKDMPELEWLFGYPFALV